MRYHCLAFLLLLAPCSIALAQPNVVIFLADDAGWGDYSQNGNTLVHTPHIDAIARAGVTLDRFIVSPVCAPTRAEFLTGAIIRAAASEASQQDRSGSTSMSEQSPRHFGGRVTRLGRLANGTTAANGRIIRWCAGSTNTLATRQGIGANTSIRRSKRTAA